MSTRAQRDILTQAYLDGVTQRDAADLAECCQATAGRFFQRCKDLGLKRGTVHRAWPGFGCYSGPDWIGKPADSPG